MSATTSVKSGVFPTEEAATSSLNGVFIEMGKNGEVKILSVTAVEVPGGWQAVAFVELSEVDDIADVKEQPEDKSVDDETDAAGVPNSELYHIFSMRERGSEAEDAIPEGEAPDPDMMAPEPESLADAREEGSGDTDSNGFGEPALEPDISSENIMLSEEDQIEAAQLSEELKTDFAVAQDDSLAPLAFMATPSEIERELEERKKKVRVAEEALMASIVTPHAETPTPAPSDS